jgi:serine phosphatase RsbU (regulator of sigma subunit)
VEVAVSQLKKHKQTVCGDSVEWSPGPPTIVVMADGLGNGTRAHHFSSVTARTASTLLASDMPIEMVIDRTMAALTEHQDRQLAYSTFTMLKITADNNVHLIEFDNPLAFHVRGTELLSVSRHKRTFSGCSVFESRFCVQDEDWIVMLSDGVLDAGIGSILNFGWSWERVGDYLKQVAHHENNAEALAAKICQATLDAYCGKPGDDATVVAVRV